MGRERGLGEQTGGLKVNALSCFLNWVPRVPLGFLVVTPYNSCIFINASLLSPAIELSKHSIENMVYEEPGVCREREQRQEQVAAGTYGVRVVVSWRCGW